MKHLQFFARNQDNSDATGSSLLLSVRLRTQRWLFAQSSPPICRSPISAFRGRCIERGTAGLFRRSADQVDRILKGTSAGDLPAEAPTQFHLVINLKTAKTLGLNPPGAMRRYRPTGFDRLQQSVIIHCACDVADVCEPADAFDAALKADRPRLSIGIAGIATILRGPLSKNLTRRANHWHIFIIAKSLEPAPGNWPRAF
jgi:hypothetical protein